MKTNNSYLKHAFNVVKNPVGYTPEAVKKACSYIQKKWDEMQNEIGSLLDQTEEMKAHIKELENEKNDMTKTIASLQNQLYENKSNAKETAGKTKKLAKK